MATNTLTLNSYYNDPYFLQAYNSPNYYNQLALLNNSMQNTTPAQSNLSVSDNTSVANTTFKGLPGATEEKQGSKKGLALGLVGTAVATGVGLILYKGRKSPGNVIQKFKSGWNNLWSKSDNAYSNRVLFQKVDGNDIVILPNQKRCITTRNFKDSDGVIAEAQSRGITGINKDLKLTDNNAILRSTAFEFEHNGIKYQGVYNLEKGVKLRENGSREILNEYDLDDGLKTTLENITTSLKNNKNVDGITGVTLKNTFYGQTINGNDILYLTNATGKAKDGLLAVRTNRFKFDDNVVITARGNDSKLNEAINEYSRGKYDSFEVIDGNWKPSDSQTFWQKLTGKKSDDYKGNITGEKWNKDTELVIKDGKVVGVKENGDLVTNDRLNALKADFPTIFENYMSHQKDFKGDIIRALK